ncbi:hypothetical protein ACRALDRAFT_207511 [Sodiomyces alcalophilus JCM 7366]|uniref:uncharacterized protein n=1 Tax=Sodiomyces alcalophilus JCM 7366 TaxID=591952 RepID=UPI0039B6327C
MLQFVRLNVGGWAGSSNKEGRKRNETRQRHNKRASSAHEYNVHTLPFPHRWFELTYGVPYRHSGTFETLLDRYGFGHSDHGCLVLFQVAELGATPKGDYFVLLVTPPPISILSKPSPCTESGQPSHRISLPRSLPMLPVVSSSSPLHSRAVVSSQHPASTNTDGFQLYVQLAASVRCSPSPAPISRVHRFMYSSPFSLSSVLLFLLCNGEVAGMGIRGVECWDSAHHIMPAKHRPSFPHTLDISVASMMVAPLRFKEVASIARRIGGVGHASQHDAGP